MKHNHRILPGHMGGEYTEGNVIPVEVTQCNKNTANHVMWHYANWCLWGEIEDRLAWKGLAGFLNKEEIIEEINYLNGKRSGDKNKKSGHISRLGKEYGKLAMSPGGWLYENRVEYARKGGLSSYPLGLGLISKEERLKIARKTYEEGKGLAAMTPQEKSEASAKGGLAGGKTNKDRKTGVCGIPPEEHSKRMSETNRQKWECPKCGMIGNARQINAHMAAEHNLPKEAKTKFLLDN